MPKKFVASSLFLEWWVQPRLLNVCQVGCNRVPIFLPARPPSSLPSAIKLESCSCLALGEWWVVGQRQWGWGAVTYCRFCGYSCGGTVIISPLLLNSVILSYISEARGQEILQFINRSTLCKGDYCMAYILTSLFGLNYFFSAVLPCPRLCPVGPYRVLSSLVVWPALFACQSASVFYRFHGEGGGGG